MPSTSRSLVAVDRRPPAVGVVALVFALLVLRVVMPVTALRATSALILLAAAGAAAVITLRLRRCAGGEAHLDGWVPLGVGVTIVAVCGAVDAGTSLGDGRGGLALAIMIGMPLVLFGVARVLRLGSMALDDRADSLLLGLTFGLVVWDARVQTVGIGFGIVGAAMVCAILSATLSAAALLSGRRTRGSEALRVLLGASLALQAIGLVLLADLLDAGRFADNVLGSSATAAGVLLAVAALSRARHDAVRVPGRTNPTVLWWAPSGTAIAVFAAHSLLGPTRGPSTADLLEIGLMTAASLLLIGRIVSAVAQREALAQRLEGERTRLSLVLRDVLDQVLLVDDSGRISDIAGGSAGVELHGRPLIGRRIVDLLAPDDRVAAEDALELARSAPGIPVALNGRLEPAADSEEETFVEAVVVDHRDNPDVGRIVVTVRDVTAARIVQRELEHLALHDTLTDLPNREGIRRRIQAALGVVDAERPLTIMRADLDALERVTDGLGQAVVDRLLVQIASRWEAELPPGAVLGRLDGGAFVVLLPWACRGGVAPEQWAQRMLSLLGTPLDLGGHRLSVSAGIGILTTTDNTQEPDEAVRDAALALADAKRRGRNRASTFSSEMRSAAAERLALEGDLREALRSRTLEAHLQPVVALATGEVAGFEALVRWTHPERGLIPAPRLIGIAEETGLIVPLGALVLDLACEAIASIRRATGRDLTVSVNVSPLQLRQAGFLTTVQAALDAHDLPTSAVTMEITESTLLVPHSVGGATLAALHAAGVRISLDDFGTGYSSLSYLGAFPLNQLKLDRSFVQSAITNQTSEAVVRGILQITEALGIPVVAEGVETHEQMALLQRLHVDFGQGWHWAPALPPAEALQHVADRATAQI